MPPEVEEDISWSTKLRKALKKNKEFLDGTLHGQFVKKALFEMQPGLHSAFMDMYFREWAEKQPEAQGKSFDKIALDDKKKLAKKFYYERSGKAHMQALEGAFNKFEISNSFASDSLKKLRDITRDEQLNDFLGMFTELRAGIRNHLFGVFDVKEGVTNPYEMETPSKFSLSTAEGRNTPLREEQVVGAMNFPGYAVNKRAYDQYYLLNRLLKRYKNGSNAIKQLFELLDNLQSYYDFVERLRKTTESKILDFPKQLEEYNKRREEWNANPENNGKPFEEEMPEAPSKFTSATIEAAIQEMMNNKNTDIEQPEKEIPETLQQIRKAQYKPLEIIEKLYQFIKNNEGNENEAVKKQVAAAKKLIDNLVHYKTIGSEENEEVAKGKVTKQKLLVGLLNNTLQGIILHTVAKDFMEELNTVLGKNGGYLNDFQKEHITNLLNDIYAQLTDESGVALQNINTSEGLVNIFDLLDTLNIISFGSEAGKEIAKISKTITDVSKNNAANEELFNLHAEVNSKVQNYNSDGVMTVADALLQKLTKKGPQDQGKKVSDIIALVNGQIASKTEPFRGFGLGRRTNTQEFILSADLVKDMDLAILVLQMLRSSYVAASDEVRSPFNHIGYNVTVNKIARETAGLMWHPDTLPTE